MYCYLKQRQKSRIKNVKKNLRRCEKKYNKKLKWQKYQRLYRYKDLMYKIHKISAWQLSHKKQQQENFLSLKCDKLQKETWIYKEIYNKKKASYEHINVKSLNDTFNNNKKSKNANLLNNKILIINYNKQQRFISRHEQHTRTDDIKLQNEHEVEEEEEEASWEIFSYNRKTRVENSLQNFIFMLNTFQDILINYTYKNNNNNNNKNKNNSYINKYNNNNYNYQYILKEKPKAHNKIAEIVKSNNNNNHHHENKKKNNNINLKSVTARYSFNKVVTNSNEQFNVILQEEEDEEEIIRQKTTTTTTLPPEIVTITGNIKESETICREIRNETIKPFMNSQILKQQKNHPTKNQQKLVKQKLEKTEKKTVEYVQAFQQVEHYIHEYQIQQHLRRQKQLQEEDEEDSRVKQANNNNNNNDKKRIINSNVFRLILLTLFVIYSCPCGNALRLANGSMLKNPTANKEQLNIGLIAPHTNFGKREYLRAINTAVSGLTKTRGAKLTFLENYSFQPRNIHFDMMSLTPSPTGKL